MIVIRKIVSCDNESFPIEIVLKTDIHIMLINMISSSFKKYPEIQYEAAWILSNIISGSSEEEMRKIL